MTRTFQPIVVLLVMAERRCQPRLSRTRVDLPDAKKPAGDVKLEHHDSPLLDC
ncbi:MAG: hypothetical protein N838_28540 [Thiohalocapsa sp. PB-PSB1]|nr:MAG: hypothetical protein N838_28540 [Thiohalocapsa sp. PB-PSB1]